VFWHIRNVTSYFIKFKQQALSW